MKKIFSLNTLWMCLILLIGVTMGRVTKINPHICIDITHQICDGQCECDGMECGSIPANVVPLRDYQMTLTQDSIYLFDGYILTGVIPFVGNTTLDSLLLKDNL